MSEEFEEYRVDSERSCGHDAGLTNEERMVERVDQLASRHIAKCLDHLGDTLAPVQIASIKRSFRFFAEDIKHVIQGEDNEDRFNR